jgi:H+/Cl- antiporter ClcA
MKHAIHLLLLLVIAASLCYLCGSFYSASLNVADWKEGTRGGTIAGFWFLYGACVLGYTAYCDLNK